jgi:hypothetical protein
MAKFLWKMQLRPNRLTQNPSNYVTEVDTAGTTRRQNNIIERIGRIIRRPLITGHGTLILHRRLLQRCKQCVCNVTNSDCAMLQTVLVQILQQAMMQISKMVISESVISKNSDQ